MGILFLPVAREPGRGVQCHMPMGTQVLSMNMSLAAIRRAAMGIVRAREGDTAALTAVLTAAATAAAGAVTIHHARAICHGTLYMCGRRVWVYAYGPKGKAVWTPRISTASPMVAVTANRART